MTRDVTGGGKPSNKGSMNVDKTGKERAAVGWTSSWNYWTTSLQAEIRNIDIYRRCEAVPVGVNKKGRIENMINDSRRVCHGARLPVQPHDPTQLAR